ncbi:hypothetical protein [Burkholderia diffusa]|uniref:EcpB family pilus assembly chaperone n=1 Tax=Burkholderia diffusa TaxID=488732 RepID=UPI000755A4DF|nr:hypothetical protein [Burkholderia diffusa]KVG36036.1 hypothetical protein WJ30_03860 [Burkholderia diffusa]
MKILKTLMPTCVVAFSLPVQAIGIGSLTTEMQEKEFYVAKQIRNDDSVAKFVSMEVRQVNNPRQLEILPQQKNDVLVSPGTVFLPPHQKADIKIYYQGLKDDKERYYQLSFIEQSVASDSQLKEGISVSAKQRLRLSSILVVRPRVIQFAYDHDAKGRVHNRGNSFVHVTATGRCTEKGHHEPQACTRNMYLLPGESADMSREQGMQSLGGIGVWKGNDYQYFPVNTKSATVVTK